MALIGISDLISSLINSAFAYTGGYYANNSEETNDWITAYFPVVSAASTLINGDLVITLKENRVGEF